MKFSITKTLLKRSIIILIFFNFNTINAQNITVNEDLKFTQLLNEKRKVNASITVNNRYKIQLFNGSSEASKKILTQFKKENKIYDATIVFSTPQYKVWIGNFKTRIEAERNLITLKKNYPNSIIIKPNR